MCILAQPHGSLACTYRQLRDNHDDNIFFKRHILYVIGERDLSF